MKAFILKVKFPFCVLIFAVSSQIQAVETSDCRETIKTSVTSKEFVQAGSKYQDLKNAVVQAGLIDAIRQTVGTDLRVYSALKLTASTDKENEEFRELSAERIAGLVKSYEIVSEDIVTSGNATLLEITLSVFVCAPDERSIVEIVAIGPFEADDIERSYRYEIERRLRAVLVERFPQGVQGYQIVVGEPDDVYHDIVVRGRVLDVSMQQESPAAARRRAQQAQANAQLMGSIIGSIFASQGLGYIGNSGYNQGQQVVILRTNVSVEVEVKATRLIEQEMISATGRAKRENLESGNKADIVTELLVEAAEKAASVLYAKVLRGRKNSGTSRGGTSSLDDTEDKVVIDHGCGIGMRMNYKGECVVASQ